MAFENDARFFSPISEREREREREREGGERDS